jgi:hypothetical protein
MLPFAKTQKRKIALQRPSVLRRHVNVAVRQNSKAQDCVTKTIRDPFTIQFTHMPRGKIAHVAATFHHIDA